MLYARHSIIWDFLNMFLIERGYDDNDWPFLLFTHFKPFSQRWFCNNLSIERLIFVNTNTLIWTYSLFLTFWMRNSFFWFYSPLLNDFFLSVLKLFSQWIFRRDFHTRVEVIGGLKSVRSRGKNFELYKNIFKKNWFFFKTWK